MQSSLGKQSRELLDAPEVNPYHASHHPELRYLPVQPQLPIQTYPTQTYANQPQQQPQPEPQTAIPPEEEPEEEQAEFVEVKPKKRRGRKPQSPTGEVKNTGRNYVPSGKPKGRPAKTGDGPIQNQQYNIPAPVIEKPLPLPPVIPPGLLPEEIPTWKKIWNKLKNSTPAKLAALAIGVGLIARVAQMIIYRRRFNEHQRGLQAANALAERVRSVIPPPREQFLGYSYSEPPVDRLANYQPVEEEHWNFERDEPEEQKEEDFNSNLRRNKEQFRALYVQLSLLNKSRIDNMVKKMKEGKTRQQLKDFEYPYWLLLLFC